MTVRPPHLRPDRPWDVITRTIDGPRLLGMSIAQVTAVVVLAAGSTLTAIAAIGRDAVPSLSLAAAGAVLTGLLAAAANAYARPLSSRRAFEAFVYLGEAELDRVARLNGGTVAPTIPAMKRYLDSVPERPEDRWIRVEFLAKGGDLDGAEAVALRMPDGTPFERLERSAALVWIDWLRGGSGDPADLRAMVREVEPADSDERRQAEVIVACAELRARVARGAADPAAALVAARDRLARHADDVLLRMTWRALPSLVRGAAVFVAVLLVLARIGSS